MFQTTRTLTQDFINFIKKFGVIGLALGVVIGQASTKLVDSIVKNLLSPILSKFVGKANLESWMIGDIAIGTLISDFLNFVIILLIVYLAVRLILNNFLSEQEKQKMNLE